MNEQMNENRPLFFTAEFQLIDVEKEGKRKSSLVQHYSNDYGRWDLPMGGKISK